MTRKRPRPIPTREDALWFAEELRKQALEQLTRAPLPGELPETYKQKPKKEGK
jgi:hypothetical protein